MGILVEVEEPKEFNKDGKTLTRWNWVIVDPMHHKSIHAVIWNDRIKRDAALIGKTVILSRFTLHNYNGSLTLNSKARSGVQAADYPSFQALEEQAMSEHKTYEQLSERRAKEEEGQGSVLKNLRELSVSVETMVSG